MISQCEEEYDISEMNESNNRNQSKQGGETQIERSYSTITHCTEIYTKVSSHEGHTNHSLYPRTSAKPFMLKNKQAGMQ